MGKLVEGVMIREDDDGDDFKGTYYTAENQNIS